MYGVCIYTCRVKVSPRSGARQVMSIGMFPHAEVARGHDWLWGDQDGMYVKRMCTYMSM